MELSPAQLEAVRRWLRDAGRSCPVCRDRRLSVVSRLYEMPEFEPPADQRGSLPVVVVGCETCGAIATFSAIALGVVMAEPTGDEATEYITTPVPGQDASGSKRQVTL